MPSPLPDFPFVPEESGSLLDAVLDGYEDFAPGQLDAINHVLLLASTVELLMGSSRISRC